jgi:type VI secretion system protein ImpK
VIVVWSKPSIISRYVRSEANRANKRKVLIPVKIDAVEPPFGFEHIQSANLVEWLTNGGGALPARLKSSISRKFSTNTIEPPALGAPTLPPPPSSDEAGRSGVGDIKRVREEIHAVTAPEQKSAELDLTPQTKGVNVPYRPARIRVPLWVAASGGLGLVAGVFAWFSIGLNATSDYLYARLQTGPPSRMPTITRTPIVEQQPVPTTPLPPPEPTALDKLRTFLKPEIDQGLVEVLGTPAQPLVRITGRGMFASGNATVQASFKPLLDRIGLSLKDEPGPVKVVGYTDDQPFRSIAFPSNFQLSLARAQAALAILATTVGDASRLSAEGRADADPIAPNSTPEGRERNRRIEIVLTRQGS